MVCPTWGVPDIGPTPHMELPAQIGCPPSFIPSVPNAGPSLPLMEFIGGRPLINPTGQNSHTASPRLSSSPLTDFIDLGPVDLSPMQDSQLSGAAAGSPHSVPDIDQSLPPAELP